MNLRIFETVDELVEATAATLTARLTPGVAATIAISGGRTPQQLYQRLSASPWRERLATSPITWVVVDERHVPPEDPQSNSAMIERTLFSTGLLPGHRFLRFRTELGDPVAVVAAFEREWHELGLTTIDVMLLGVGEDGHTASLFPGTTALDVQERVATEVYVPAMSQWRLTLTMEVIRAATLRLVLAPGASKAAIIADLRAGADLPAARATADVESWWMVDRAAVTVAE